MMAEVAACFPGMASGDTPWPLFLGLYFLAPRFDARRQLTAMLATGAAIGSVFGGDAKGQVEELIEQAYPVKRTAPQWIRNAFAEDGGEAPDA